MYICFNLKVDHETTSTAFTEPREAHEPRVGHHSAARIICGLAVCV